MDYYNKKTKKKVTADEYRNMSETDKQSCVPFSKHRTKSRGKKSDNEGTKPSLNDYTWYEINDVISKAVGNIPMNRFPGTSFNDENYQFASLVTHDNVHEHYREPGVMSINVIPAFGAGKEQTSALNLAARSMYVWVRHQNSGRANYQASDLMLYVMAMDSLYAQYVHAKRIYSTVCTYTYENKYLPVALAKAYGINLANVQTALADFRAQLNIFARKMSAMCVPATFDIVKRHHLIFSTVFSDADSLRGQMYTFNPTGFWVYNPVQTSTGGGLDYKSFTGTSGNRNVTDIMRDLNTALDAIMSDDDMNIMSGDILKAYGRENLFNVGEVDELSILDIKYDETVLQQIENARSWGYSDMQYTQEGGLLQAKFRVESDVVTNMLSYSINSHKLEPDYRDIIEYTRDMCTPTDFGTEAVIDFTWYCFDKEGALIDGRMSTLWVAPAPVERNDMAEFFANWVYSQSIISKFDWHPILNLLVKDSDRGTSGTTVFCAGTLADYKVAGIIYPEDLKRLHDAAIMGVLGKLVVGK